MRLEPHWGDSAFTLVELAVVVVLLTALAGLVISAAGSATTQAMRTVTLSSLTTVRDAIVGRGGSRVGPIQPCFVHDVGRLPRRPEAPMVLTRGLHELFVGNGLPAFDPANQRGWRGPYLLAPLARFGRPDQDLELDPPQWGLYGSPGDTAVLDGYGRPLLLQVPDPDRDGVATPADERYARLVSAGPDGRIDTPSDPLDPSLTACADDIVVYLWIADPRP